MDFLSASVVVSLSFFTIVYAYFKYAFGYWKSKGVLYEEPSFPFGNAEGLGRKQHMTQILKHIYDKYKWSGEKIVGIYLFATPCAVVLDMELVKNILNRDFWTFDEKIEYSDEINEPISARLTHIHGKKWKETRGKLTPAFSSSKMKVMFHDVIEKSQQFCDCLLETIAKHRANGNDACNSLEIYDWCTRFVIDSTASCAFGIESHSLRDKDSEFSQYARKMGLYALHSPLFLAFLNGIERVAKVFRIKTIPIDVSAFVTKMVADTIQYRQKHGLYRGDFLDTLIGADEKEKPRNFESKFTFEEMTAHAMSFLLGSFNNSPTNLAYCLYELSVNQDIQTKARHIIEETFNKYDGKFTYEMMMDIPYIDQIIEGGKNNVFAIYNSFIVLLNFSLLLSTSLETLRHYPTPIITRMANKDYAIDGTDIVFDKRTRLIIPVQAIHHDERFYKNPDKFDPDRFESKVKNERNPFTWLPFGSGPRTWCVNFYFKFLCFFLQVIF